MKKIIKKIIFIIIVFMLILSTILTIYANENTIKKEYSSKKLNKNEMQFLDTTEESDTAIRIYGIRLFEMFSDKENIEKAFNELNLSKEYYLEYSYKDEIHEKIEINKLLEESKEFEYYAIISHSQILSYQSIKNGRIEYIESIYNNEEILPLVIEEKNIISYISPKAKINDIYYFCGGGNQGVAVYYITNMGDYVYYNPMPGGDNEYIMPADDFRKFASFAYAKILENPLADGGVDISSIFDLSPYAVNISNKVNVALIVGFVICGIIICGVITVGILILYKRKREIKNMNAI